MARPQSTPEASTQETMSGTKGRRILKWGLLASPCVVPIDGKPKLGNFGKLDVPLEIDGQRFILPLSPQNPEYESMLVAFGEPGNWEGCSVQVSDGKMLKQVSIVPIAGRDGVVVKK